MEWLASPSARADPVRPSVLANVPDEPRRQVRAKFFAALGVSGRDGHHSDYQGVESDDEAKSDCEEHPHAKIVPTRADGSPEEWSGGTPPAVLPTVSAVVHLVTREFWELCG